MNKYSCQVLIALLMLTACATTSTQSEIEQLAQLLQGRYDTHASGHETELPTDQRFIDSRQRVHMPDLGEVVFYLQLDRGDPLNVYRQRILLFESIDDQITQRAFVLKDPGRFVDARSGDEILANLQSTDIEPMFSNGCEQIWRRVADGFSGYTNPTTCRVLSKRDGRPRRIESSTLVTATELQLTERGFDDDMAQLFGTPPGQWTTLVRVNGAVD